ncbi:MAG: riboflavin kinase [Actinomycetota bacterium]
MRRSARATSRGRRSRWGAGSRSTARWSRVTGGGGGLGFPTANLRTWPRLLLPGQGIYAGVAELGGSRHRAAIDVGTNPTFGVEPLHVEAFLLDFEGRDLRGRPIAIEFWGRLRDEVKYDAVDDLVSAIADDVRRTRAIVPDTQPIRRDFP